MGYLKWENSYALFIVMGDFNKHPSSVTLASRSQPSLLRVVWAGVVWAGVVSASWQFTRSVQTRPLSGSYLVPRERPVSESSESCERGHLILRLLKGFSIFFVLDEGLGTSDFAARRERVFLSDFGHNDTLLYWAYFSADPLSSYLPGKKVRLEASVPTSIPNATSV